MSPRLSVVVLTWNEERNIGPTLAALARQRMHDFELIVVDAASTDRTAAILRAAQPDYPVPLRLSVASTRLPIGEARNRGVAMAKSDLIVFLSADAEPDEHWTYHMAEALAKADMAFGAQLHSPDRWTTAAAVRGLRYHFPDGETKEPLRFASNVAAGYKREILLRHPFDPWANAAEDLLLAQRAARDGYTAVYNHRMVVRHRDVVTVRQEMRKNVREGYGCGAYVAELGLQREVLAWGGAVAVATAVAVWMPLYGLPLLAAALWVPAVRRAFRRHSHVPGLHLVRGVAASPAFDLAFLVQYVHGLALGRRTRKTPKETPT